MTWGSTNLPVTEWIGKTIHRLFPTIPLYSEQSEQGFKSPAFYLYSFKTEATDELMDAEWRKHDYSLVYFPSANDDLGKREQAEGIKERLLDEFQRVDGLKYRPLNREVLYQDDTLIFNFRIQYRVHRVREMNYLHSVTHKEGVKHGEEETKRDHI
ncbi:MAG: hypothetical protein Q4A55_06650 [Aerococcus sp.]|nr:hypothetical protein [Aerococcus sp.]